VKKAVAKKPAKKVAATKAKPAPKKVAAKKVLKKAVAKKPVKKIAAKKSPKKVVAKKPIKKAAAKKAVARKAPAKKVVATKKPAKKIVANELVAKKPVAKKAPVKKIVAKKVPAKKVIAKKPVAKKAATRKAVTAKVVIAPKGPRYAGPDWPLMNVILDSMEDSKAEEILPINVMGRSSMADGMVIASGRANRHVAAIADQLVDKLKAYGQKDIRVEGLETSDWVLVDAGDIIVHIFRPEVRSFYNLEKLWSEHAPVDPSASE
jgi:ribosome-associated protein